MSGDGGVFAADPEVGPDLAAVDWAASRLGRPSDWPQSLRTAVSILLSSRFPMWMAWGPELTFFCNAAYRRDTLGQKYPWALGRPAGQVWAEIWGDIGPRIERVLATGAATWDEGLLLLLERSGYPEETYHTFSYSPLRDDDGVVVGMLCVVSEDTDRVIGERRMSTLRDLGTGSTVLRTERELLEFTTVQLERNPYDLPFALTYLFDDDAVPRLASAAGLAPGHPAAPPLLPASGAAVWPAAAPDEPVLVELTDPALGVLPTGGFAQPPAQALVVPLPGQGDAPLGFLVAGLNRYRPLDAAYRGFLELVAGHLTTGVLGARAYRDQQRRAEELAALDRAKTTFFSNISHEFRTPLTLISGPVQELRARLADADPAVREEVEVIHRNGLRLAKLVNTLLEFSRLEAGRMSARYEPVDLAETTAELASVFRSAVDRAGLELRVDCPPLDRPVYVDRDMWEKVVLNLLSNAVKFTFDGSVTVRLRADVDHAVLSVTDTGVGVSATELPRLFERFHRVEHVRARSSEGSGIGLALVKELVGLHGGTIAATSGPGRGTTFTIRLPFGHAHLPAGSVIEDAPNPPRPATGAEPFVAEALRWLPDRAPDPPVPAGYALETSGTTGSPAGLPTVGTGRWRPARLVVADDNADMRDYLGRLLRGAGHQVRTAADGPSALAAVRADPPELLISDVMMPGLDGLALVAALRATGRTAGVPVLLLSARAGAEASVQGLDAGADDYLVKPFAAAELLARVRALTALARLRTHHARWRTALIDSLQEGFFLCEADGRLVEINSAFSDILGYGPDVLPHPPPYAWWPDPDTDPRAYQRVRRAFSRMVDERRGEARVPLVHRDGHRVWVRVGFSRIDDPESGRHMIVGTMGDITAERYATQRETALAVLGERLAQADTVPEALAVAVGEFQRTYAARRVVLALFPYTPTGPATRPDLTADSDRSGWAELSPELRERLLLVSRDPELSPRPDDAGRVGVAVGQRGGVLVVWIDSGERRPVAAEDQALLTVLTGRLGQGLDRVREIDERREAAVALQHAILGPARLPSGFAVRYQPAARAVEVGGDWYDTVPLPGERIGVVVGDCVGNGLAAATAMGQVRSACRALLLEHPDPVRTLAGLDRFAALLPGARCTTVFCAVLEPATGTLVYSSAGHPPPILIHADGRTETLTGGHGIPVGLRVDRPRTRARVVLPARATLLIYTDGLVERRRRSLDEGITRAAAAVHDGRDRDVEQLASDLMTSLAPASGYEDDVALLLYRQPGPLQISFAADRAELAPVRHALREWLGRCDLDAQQATDVLIAAGEACDNAVEHGHRDLPDGAVELRATALAGQLRVRVTDTGSWKTPDPEATAQGHRGRGLALMRGLMQRVTIEPSDSGTVVEMIARIAP